MERGREIRKVNRKGYILSGFIYMKCLDQVNIDRQKVGCWFLEEGERGER